MNKEDMRNRDILAIENGASAKELRGRNFMFSGLDMSKVEVIAPNGYRFKMDKEISGEDL